MSWHTYYVVRCGSLGVCQSEATHLAALWCCMWGPRGNNATCWALIGLSVTSPTTHKQIGPFWCWVPGGWVCVCSRTLWVSPTNSSMRLGVSPTAATTTGFYSQRFFFCPSFGYARRQSVATYASISARSLHHLLFSCKFLRRRFTKFQFSHLVFFASVASCSVP